MILCLVAKIHIHLLDIILVIKFLFSNSGKIKLKLIPPSNGKYLQKEMIMIFLNLVLQWTHDVKINISQNLIK